MVLEKWVDYSKVDERDGGKPPHFTTTPGAQDFYSISCLLLK